MKLQATFCFLLQLLFEHSLCTRLTVTTGVSLELPCFPARLPELVTAPITWTFNGMNLGAEASDSVRIKENGSYLSIFPVTVAHQGQYVCLVNQTNMNILRAYTITVTASLFYEINALQGSTIYLPCIVPQSNQIPAKALWYKETDAGQRSDFREGASGEMQRLQRYPLAHDQSVIITNVVSEDSGTYYCEYPVGVKLSTILVTVKAPVPYSCGEFATEWKPCLDQDSRSDEAVLQESLAEFSMKLYSFLRESLPSDNILVSPLSISTLLSHLLLGARGKTQRAIESALSVPHEFSCIHFHIKKLKEKLDTSLQMASQIYYHPDINLSESFTNHSIQFYEAVPTRLLETSEENTNMINSWVANKTNNKIQRLVDSVSSSTQLMLLNAVSFKGQWELKFDSKPKKRHFTKPNGDLVSVWVLYHQSYPLAMTLDTDLKAMVARFALTGETSLYVLLPASHTMADLQQVEERMTDTALLRMIHNMKTIVPQKAEVILPRIKLDVKPDMFMLMKKLGLMSLFEDANLCGLYSEDRLVLDEVRHRGFLALTEQGVEAVAVTSVSFSRTYISFSALQPFVFLLWSDQANVPLFVGRVIDP
ncbi:unnamed protein product, partial [Tetraodon nigroviridis]